MLFSNTEMDTMVNNLEPVLEQRNKIGYAAARNTRILRTELQEFYQFRDKLIMQYGDYEKDEDGNPLTQPSISPTSPNFVKFLEELAPFGDTKHEIDIFTVPMDEAIGVLSGSEILALDWMLEE